MLLPREKKSSKDPQLAYMITRHLPYDDVKLIRGKTSIWFAARSYLWFAADFPYDDVKLIRGKTSIWFAARSYLWFAVDFPYDDVKLIRGKRSIWFAAKPYLGFAADFPYDDVTLILGRKPGTHFLHIYTWKKTISKPVHKLSAKHMSSLCMYVHIRK
jgi:hypothetical protein